MAKFIKGHPPYRHKDPTKWHTIVCPCGVSVHCKIITSYGVRKYCSNACKGKYRRKDWTRQPHSKETRLKIGLANKRVYSENPERLAAWKGGVSRNPGYKSAMKRKSRLNTVGSHTWTEWVNLKIQYLNMCPACGKSEPEIKLTQDHIIPLIKGGSDYIDNIQPLCGPCNSKKSRKVIKYEFADS